MLVRWRLTLWFSAILFTILLFSGTVFYFLLQRYLYREVDGNLILYSARVHGTLSQSDLPDPLDYNVIHSQMPPINEFASPGIYIQLINRNGNIVVKSDNLGGQELPVNVALTDRGFGGSAAIGTVAAGGGAPVRIMVSPLYLGDETLLLEVAQSLNPIDSTMSQLKWALLAGILIALVLAGAVGTVLSRRALSPVEYITQTAKGIEESSDLTRRVGYTGHMDEFGELAATFDHMIEHLDKAFKSQKFFVANASHELRTPLTVIKGNTDLLRRNLSEEDRRESLKAIESEARRMSKIVDDLLLLAEIESGQVERYERVNLKELVLEESKRARQLAGSRKILIGNLEDLTTRGDSYRLRQLLGNLVDNAIRYTPEDGTVTLSLVRNGEWAHLTAADTGIGIASEHLPHIFGRFYVVDRASSRAKGGTGLGLAIVKEIAEQHSGRVTVASEPGKGSTFTVWLKL